MINKAVLIGNVGGEPEIRTLESNVKVATFSLATSETYNDKTGKRKTVTQWHRIVAWRGLAGVIEQYVHKGTQVYIEGKITYRDYKTKEGDERQITEIVAEEMKLLGSKKTGAGETIVAEVLQEPKVEYVAPSEVAPEPEKDLPF